MDRVLEFLNRVSVEPLKAHPEIALSLVIILSLVIGLRLILRHLILREVRKRVLIQKQGLIGVIDRNTEEMIHLLKTS